MKSEKPVEDLRSMRSLFDYAIKITLKDFELDVKTVYSLKNYAYTKKYLELIIQKNNKNNQLAKKYLEWLNNNYQKEKHNKQNIRDSIKEELGPNCQICERKSTEIENLPTHQIIPQIDGGPTEKWNTLVLCQTCKNLTKRANHLIKNKLYINDIKKPINEVKK